MKVYNNNQLYKSPAGDKLWNSGRQDWIFGRIGDQEGTISDPATECMPWIIILHLTEFLCIRDTGCRGNKITALLLSSLALYFIRQWWLRKARPAHQSGLKLDSGLLVFRISCLCNFCGSYYGCCLPLLCLKI